SGSGNLLSLSDLWSKESSTLESQTRHGQVNVRIKLEEERYRRQHCERLIQQLQSRLLEEQQRLAVAVEVDKSKDQAILQLQDAWSRLVHHWKELEEQRHGLANKLQSEREANQRRESEWGQRVKQLECELSKALDLAQGYKDKFDVVEKEKFEILEIHKAEIEVKVHEIQEIKEKLDEVNHIHNQLIKENNDHKEKVKEAEQASQKMNLYWKILEFGDSALIAIKKRIQFKLKLKEEKGRINILDQQKKSLQSSLDESKKKEISARDELKQLSSQIEKEKLELKEFYQKQLDIVVNNKVEEFQRQLDAAEVDLHKEIEQREHAISEIASKQIKQITEKHQLEVQLLEEKHAEELHLYKFQLGQAMQQISQLETKLQVYNSRKSEIVEKLHNVMETQWQEALRIISGNSPLVNNGSDHNKLQKGSNLSKIGTGRWPLSTHKSGSKHKTNPVPDFKTFHQVENKVENWGPSNEINKIITSTPQNIPGSKDTDQFRVPPIHIHEQSAGSSTADESPFCQEGLLTSRMAEQAVSLQDTPSAKESAQTIYENELRRYIMMLLNRAPGNPANEETDSSNRVDYFKERKTQDETPEKKEEYSDVPTNETSHLPKWEKILKQDSQCSLTNGKRENFSSVSSVDFSKAGYSSMKGGRHTKAPWK
ncbi:hypothetical protein L9F63_020856, partial [Diploptera punctata]